MSAVVDQAIAAMSARSAPVQKRFAAKIPLASSGRMVGIEVPLDLSPLELVDLISQLTTQLPAALVKAAEDAPTRLFVPR